MQSSQYLQKNNTVCTCARGHIEECYLCVDCIREHFTLMLVLCCESDSSGECMGHMCTLLTFLFPCP